MEIDKALLLAHSPREIANGALDRVCRQLCCQWAAVTLFQNAHQRATLLTSQNKSSDGGDEADGETLNWALDELETLSATHGKTIPREFRVVRQSGLRSRVCLPLVGQNKLIGALNLARESAAGFSEDELATAREVADHLAIALQQASLFQQVQNAREQLQSLSHRLIEAQETERRHLARELHDEIGQSLTAIKINLQNTAESSAATSAAATPVAQQRLGESLSLIEMTLQQVRNLSLDLRPSLLDDLGLSAALRWFLDRQEQRTAITIQFFDDLAAFGIVRLPSEIETTVFRIVQEAVNNVTKHADAQAIEVALSLVQTQSSGSAPYLLQLYIRDDGRGFNVEDAQRRAVSGSSFGLLGMEERATLAGGTFHLLSNPGGTVIQAYFPLNHSGEEMPLHEQDSACGAFKVLARKAS